MKHSIGSYLSATVLGIALLACPAVMAGAAGPSTQGVAVSGANLAAGWIPMHAVVAAFSQAGWTAQWSASTSRLDLTPPPHSAWHRPAGGFAGQGGTHAVDLAVDGVPVGVIPAQVLADPVTGSLEVYVSPYSIQRVLGQIGVTARLEGTVWDLTELSTQVPLAPAMKPDTILDSTLVSVAGVTTDVSDDISADSPSPPSSAPLSVRLDGQPLPVIAKVLMRDAGGASSTERILRFTFQVPSTLPAGHYPVTVTWALPGRPRSYSALVRVPALFIAEQDGVYEDNMLGHRLHPRGRFAKAPQPTGIAFDPQNQRLYVSDANAGAIFVYATSGRLVATLDPPQVSAPTYLAIDAPDGRLFVYNDGGTHPGIVEMTLSGHVIALRHDRFKSVFALGNAMAYDPATHDIYVTRSLTGSQRASGSPAVVVYSAATGARVRLAGAFSGLGANPTGITYDPGTHEILVSGFYRRSSSRHHYVVAFTGAGVRVSGPDAFGIGSTNSGHASAIADDPATGLIAVVGDTHLHFFTPAGDPVPPLTSRSDSATPLAGLGHGGTVAAAIAY